MYNIQRRKNYVLGQTATQTAYTNPADRPLYVEHAPLVTIANKLPIKLILGGALIAAFLGRKAQRSRNAILGAVAAFGVAHFMKPKALPVIVEEELPITPAQEDEF